MPNEPLIDAIDRFLRAFPMSDAMFGKRSIGQSSIVQEMRTRGRVPGPVIDKKMRDFIAEQVERVRREYPR